MVDEKKHFIRGLCLAVVMLTLSLFIIPVGGHAQELDEQVAVALAGGQKFLYNNFIDIEDGTGYYRNDSKDAYRLAATAAAVAALIETGKYGDPAYAAQVDKAVEYIKMQKNGDGSYGSGHITYQTGMSLVALSLYHGITFQPIDFINDYIQPAVDYFLNGQYDNGSWGYQSCGNYCVGRGDLSNTQFAIMGLWYADHYVLSEGIPTSIEDSWAWRLLDWVKKSQYTSGAFGYYPGDSFFAKGPMTGAGLWALAMLGVDKEDANVKEALAWFDSNYAWTNTNIWGSAYYYGVYAMAKGLTGLLTSNYQFDTAATGNPWPTDLKQAMVEAKIPLGEDGCYWVSGGFLDPGAIISTSWVLMALAFSDPDTPATKKILPDPDDADYPIRGRGFVTLETSDDVTIAKAERGNVSEANKADSVLLPIGSFGFELYNVTPGGTAVLKIVPPVGTFDSDEVNSFINEDGSIKDGLSWFKIQNGEWKGQAGVRIRLMPVGGPYTYIEVTLRDGGPEDEDGLVNGIIVDPGAPGVGAITEPSPTTGGGGGGGCFVSSLVL